MALPASHLPDDHSNRLQRMQLALEGLSLGDAFGQRFFGPLAMGETIVRGELPLPPWKCTDDTERALAIAAVLTDYGRVQQDELAQEFALRYVADPHRCYGAGMHDLLGQIAHGAQWHEAAPQLFRGDGSLGNGSAMRVAPVAGYFADDWDEIARQARASAEVTHAHHEGIAGAIAAAVAGGWAWQWSASGWREPRETLLEVACRYTPRGDVWQGLNRACQLPLDEWEFTAAECLGNGEQITCADTVPFCLWAAAKHLDHYEEALWTTVRVGGDIDTNAAIVGGIVALAVGSAGLPAAWLRCRESLVLRV